MSLAAMQAQAALPTPTFTCNGAINSPGAIRASGLGEWLNTKRPSASPFANSHQELWQYAVRAGVPSGILAVAGEVFAPPSPSYASASERDLWLPATLTDTNFVAYDNGLAGDGANEFNMIGNSIRRTQGGGFQNARYQVTTYRYTFDLSAEVSPAQFNLSIIPSNVDDAFLAVYVNGKKQPPPSGRSVPSQNAASVLANDWKAGMNTLDLVMQNNDPAFIAVKFALASSSTASCVYVIGGNPISSVDTNTPPVISGTSTMPPGMQLDVEIRDPAGNLLDTVPTTVQPDGSWTVTAPRPYPEGTGYSGTPVVKPTDPDASPADVPQGSPQPFDVTGAPPGNFTVGGTVTGLPPGSQLILTNGTDTLTVDANGPFTFPNSVPDESSFTVLVGTQPNGAVCTVANGTGQIAGANATNVAVTCTAGNQPPGPGQATAVPTLSEWALILMSALLAGLAAVGLRRRS
ncbi:IPTL-CTERM sorting domain-containing protein [Diaphorobacter sp.]|uniref:IPTL-CTERM sorting domain-containing protein n=1 Tax=Diaphorobacter sp. TaxID=1934310 RepID=UPI0028A892C4|nr:IPTL-CTERM sorting domain-containing protein [Diaphorobacter sp.]